jgi:hypothetical protein
LFGRAHFLPDFAHHFVEVSRRENSNSLLSVAAVCCRGLFFVAFGQKALPVFLHEKHVSVQRLRHVHAFPFTTTLVQQRRFWRVVLVLVFAAVITFQWVFLVSLNKMKYNLKASSYKIYIRRDGGYASSFFEIVGGAGVHRRVVQ